MDTSIYDAVTEGLGVGNYTSRYERQGFDLLHCKWQSSRNCDFEAHGTADIEQYVHVSE